MLVSGFVTWELLTEWPSAEKVFMSPPVWFASACGWPAAAGWLKGAWALVIVPVVLWAALAGATRLIGEKENIANVWRRMALPMAVVIAAGHMSKGLAKFVSWSQFLPGALSDPTGLGTVKAISAKTLPSPAPLLGLSTVAIVALALVLATLFYGLREHRFAHPVERRNWRAYFPFAALAVAFGAVIVGWIVEKS